MYFLYKKWDDRDMISLMKSNVRINSVVLDIGANIGFYSLLFSKFVGPGGLVLGFEPDKFNFFRMKRLAKGNKNIFPYNVAVSNSTNEINLYISSEMNVDHRTYDNGDKRSTIQVQAVSIDEFLEVNFPDLKIDVIKIDIQGFDYIAFQGMKNTIRKAKNLIIFGEYWPYALGKTGIEPLDYYKELIKEGFQVTFIPSLSLTEITTRTNDPHYYTNFMAIKDCNAALIL